MHMKLPRAGEKVSGRYYSIPFNGTVSETRPNYMNYGLQIFFVSLDQPIVVHGLERQFICVTVETSNLERQETDSAIHANAQ